MGDEATIREPTAEECEANALIAETAEQVAYAIWYPQMGGYVAKAVVAFFKDDKNNRCFDVSVWHTGTWPFADCESGNNLHHCDAEQFIEFGKTVLKLQGLEEDDKGETPAQSMQAVIEEFDRKESKDIEIAELKALLLWCRDQLKTNMPEGDCNFNLWDDEYQIRNAPEKARIEELLTNNEEKPNGTDTDQ